MKNYKKMVSVQMSFKNVRSQNCYADIANTSHGHPVAVVNYFAPPEQLEFKLFRGAK